MRDSFADKTAPLDVDPLDLQLDRLGAAPARARRAFAWQTRLAVGWATGSFPAVLLLLLGMSFGPKGLALLTPDALALIDPAVPVALAALGVVVGLGIPTRRSRQLRLFAAGTVEALFTGALVATGVLFSAPSLTESPALHTWMFAAAAGVCAATSSGLPASDLGARAPRLPIKDFDARVPVIAGALLLAVMNEGAIRPGLALAGQACVVALLIAVCGWLLLSGTSSDAEQRVFAVATLLLVGGVADYLSLSALLSGVIAGAFWQVAGGAAREAIHRDIAYVQHPLAVVLLLVAGASVAFTLDELVIVAVYVLLRTAAKLMGAWLARGLAGPSLPSGSPLGLTSPGIFGVAFAMNVLRASGPDMAPLVGAVVIGTVASQLISAFDNPGEDRA